MKNLFRIQSTKSESGNTITLFLSGTLLEENISFLHINCTELAKAHDQVDVDTSEITNIDEAAASYLVKLNSAQNFSVINPSLYLKSLLCQLDKATFRS